MELQYSDLSKLKLDDEDLAVIRADDIKPSDVRSLIQELRRAFPTWKGYFIVLPPDAQLTKLDKSKIVALRDALNTIID